MEVTEALRRRRMTRAFRPDPLPDDLVDHLVWAARRAPAAGNTDALDLLVLSGPEQTAAYWDTTLPTPRRAGFRWQGLLDAPLLLVPWTSPEAYADRYAEPDKARTGLGEGPEAWSVPYWWIDGGQALALVQLAAVEAGVGVCLFGLFEHEPAVRERFGVPSDRRALGCLAVGYPSADEPGRSAGRDRRTPAVAAHRGRWGVHQVPET